MKVANIIVAHKNPEQLQRLIRQYDTRLFHHFVHIDRKCRWKDFQSIASLPGVTVLPRRHRMVYAGYGFVAATLDAFVLLKKAPEHFFYVNVMSGLDFPIRPTAAFYDFLRHSYENEQREFFEILDVSVWPGAHRFERFHLQNWTIRGRYFTERIINRVIPKRQFYGGKLTPYGRAAWFTATDHFVDYALAYFRENPDYIRFLKTVWSPDEFIFNTLVMNSPYRAKISDYLRYIDWSAGLVTPKVFTIADLPVLLDSGCFMARKFDTSVDGVILDALESAITPKSFG